MRRFDGHAVITGEIAQFQTEVRRLALEIARAVIRQELDGKLSALRPARPAKREPAPVRRTRREPMRRTRRPSARQVEAPQPVRQLELGLPPSVPREPVVEAAPPPPPSAEPAPEPAPAQPPAAPVTGRKRGRWTRETIISELATWMSKGTTIDAPFMTRHGPPGLVAAARRVFGRFDAALNVVALHLSKTAPPEAPPTR